MTGLLTLARSLLSSSSFLFEVLNKAQTSMPVLPSCFRWHKIGRTHQMQNYRQPLHSLKHRGRFSFLLSFHYNREKYRILLHTNSHMHRICPTTTQQSPDNSHSITTAWSEEGPEINTWFAKHGSSASQNNAITFWNGMKAATLVFVGDELLQEQVLFPRTSPFNAGAKMVCDCVNSATFECIGSDKTQADNVCIPPESLTRHIRI